MSHGNEPQASADDPIAVKCAAYAHEFTEKADSVIYAVTVTSNPTWGVVFRADIGKNRGDLAPINSRMVCANNFTFVGRIALSNDGP